MTASHPLCRRDEVCYSKKLNLRGPRDTKVELEFKKIGHQYIVNHNPYGGQTPRDPPTSNVLLVLIAL